MFDAKEIALIMALPTESQGLFEEAGITVHYSGIGKVNAAMTATEVILKTNCSRILNLGTAGSHRFSAHELIEISATVQRDMDLSPLGFPKGETPMDSVRGKIEIPTFISGLKKGICGTGDNFEISAPKVLCDLVDMEAHAIAKVCRKHAVEFTAVKYITDGSDQSSHQDWVGNLKPASRKLLEIYNFLTK